MINTKGKVVVPVMYDTVDIDYEKSSYHDNKTYLSAKRTDGNYDLYDEQGVLAND